MKWTILTLIYIYNKLILSINKSNNLILGVFDMLKLTVFSQNNVVVFSYNIEAITDSLKFQTGKNIRKTRFTDKWKIVAVVIRKKYEKDRTPWQSKKS